MSLAAGSASAGSGEFFTRYGPVGGTADEKASEPAGDATKAMNFFAASMCLLDLGMY
jgi:hypothetical protein